MASPSSRQWLRYTITRRTAPLLRCAGDEVVEEKPENGSGGDARRPDGDDHPDLLASGAIAAVIDRTYPLADIPAAHRHVEQSHKRGNVVIRIDG